MPTIFHELPNPIAHVIVPPLRPHASIEFKDDLKIV